MSDELLELQTQISFQEDTVQQLNDVVTRQQSELERLRKEMSLLKRQVELIISGQLEIQGDEAPPPHY